jgi:hypothetical protein
MLDCSLLFIPFSFVGCHSVSPGAALDYVPRGWVGELRVVHDAYLFVLQIHTSSFGVSQRGEMALLFSMWCGVSEAFHWLGVQDVSV